MLEIPRRCWRRLGTDFILLLELSVLLGSLSDRYKIVCPLSDRRLCFLSSISESNAATVRLVKQRTLNTRAHSDTQQFRRRNKLTSASKPAMQRVIRWR